MKNIIRFALLLVLLFVSTANSQVIVVNPIQDAEFNTEIAVTAGAGTWSYEFLLTPASTPTSDDEEWIRVDFVNANVDFTFTLGHLENENPHEDAVAPRKQSLKFLSLKLSNDKVVTTTGKYELDVGVVLRWRYRPSNVAVSQSSLMFAGYREFRYFDFEHGTELDADTSTIAQSFGRDELMPGDNIIGIFGGEAVQVPDDDDPRYNKFGTSYELEVAQNGKYVYQLSGKQFFDFEIINPSYAFSHTITRSNTNPTSSQVPTGLTALHYFSLDITSAQQPGPTGLRYGAVLRFRYPDGIASNIDQTTLNFMYHDGTKWSTFSQKAERSVYTKYLSQSTNEFLELKKLKMDFALVADVSGAPVESSTPVVEQSSSSPITQPSTPTDGQESNPVESLPVEQRESSDAVSSGQVKFFIALIALVIAVAL